MASLVQNLPELFGFISNLNNIISYLGDIDLITYMCFVSTGNLAGLRLACFLTAIVIDYVRKMPMPGIKCPRCLARGIVQWVLPGKHCPSCNNPC